MKIVFIQPNVGYQGHAWEPLGIGYMIAGIRKMHPNVNIEFVSGFYESDTEIIDVCVDADIIGFSCSSPQFKHAISLANQIKTPENLIVFGGVHPTALPYASLKEKNIDIVVQGEGEYAILDIISQFKKGITLRKDWKADFIQNLDAIPFPDRTAIKNERCIQQAYKDNGLRITSVMSGRGCPFNCSFCCSHCLWGRKPRLRSADNILDEFEQLINIWDIEFIKFADDTFTVNKQRVLEFCRKKQERDINIPFLANAHINTIDEEVLDNLKKANCTMICYGVESGSPKVLHHMHKHTKIEDIKRVFRLTRNKGIKTRAYFLLGTPVETREDIRMTEHLAEELQPDEVGFTLLAPYPDNEYFNYELMKDWDWSHFDEYGNDWVHNEGITNADYKQIQNELALQFKENLSYVQRRRL